MNVRNTLLVLGTGTVFQRLCQLLSIACVARELGVARTGLYAQGIAAGSVLAILSGAGIRNHVAREVARQPGEAGAWVRAAVRGRALAAGILVALFAAAAAIVGQDPWFWILCATLALPAAFDLKGLLDAAARTRIEVALESGSGLLQLGMVLAWAATGTESLVALAGIHLASRSVYALGAIHAIRRLPAGTLRPSLAGIVRSAGAVSVAQTLSEVATVADVWLVGIFGGQQAAGLYAVAQRLAAAAGMPSAQIARLLLPHLLRAASDGDPARTTRTALRATAWATLPLAAGGMVVAEPLCGLFGPGFVAAGDALRLLLLAMACQHFGWQCSHALYADDRDRAYAATLVLPALSHGLLLLVLAAPLGATGAGLSALTSQALYFAVCLTVLRGRRDVGFRRGMGAPWLAAGVTGGAALVVNHLLPEVLPPLPAVIAGAAAFGLMLWCLELRSRWHRLGEGLVRASGFGS